MTYDAEARVLSRRYSNSVIRSSARLTYEQTDRILKGHTKGVTKPVMALLRNMEALARRIEDRSWAESE